MKILKLASLSLVSFLVLFTMTAQAAPGTCVSAPSTIQRNACGQGPNVPHYAVQLVQQQAWNACGGPNRTQFLSHYPVQCRRVNPVTHCCDAVLVFRCQVACQPNAEFTSDFVGEEAASN